MSPIRGGGVVDPPPTKKSFFSDKLYCQPCLSTDSKEIFIKKNDRSLNLNVVFILFNDRNYFSNLILLWKRYFLSTIFNIDFLQLNNMKICRNCIYILYSDSMQYSRYLLLTPTWWFKKNITVTCNVCFATKKSKTNILTKIWWIIQVFWENLAEK